MKQIKLPNPPNPDDLQYSGNPLALQRAIYTWQMQTKGKIEQASLNNDTPLDQNFVVTSYALSTSLAGTSTGTDITNFVCSLVNAFTRKGAIKTINVTHD